MKKLTILSFVAALMAAFSFTSCNTGGDSYSPPTIDEQRLMINSLGSSQSGGIVYYNENKLDTKDVIDYIPGIDATITSETYKDKDGNIKTCMLRYLSTSLFLSSANLLMTTSWLQRLQRWVR